MANYIALPKSWSNKGKVERLRSDAYASLTRMMAIAVADTNSNYYLYSGLRTREEQIALFKANYRNTGRKFRLRPSDRKFNGTYWSWLGKVKVASPDLGSNHQSGVAGDIHPAPIQEWIKKNGQAYGWDWAEGKRNNENWHFRYYPERDKHQSEGSLDHAAIQRVVGAVSDGKIGPASVIKIREWQAQHGLVADGKVGAATKAAILSGATSSSTPVTATSPDDFSYTYKRDDWDTQVVSDKVHEFDHDVKGVYLHYPASGNISMANDTVEKTFERIRGYRKMHVTTRGWFDIAYNAAVDQKGNTYELRGLQNESGANGGQNSNNEAIAILLLVGDDEEPSEAMKSAVQGLLRQVRAKHPSAVYVRGHKQSPDASTACPGSKVMALIQNGSFSYDGEGSANAPSIAPSTRNLPTGKDLMMALLNAPDFPLLRTDSHKCYYGPASGPIESVSGKNENSLNPGDVVGGGSKGLKLWQAKMNARGYSLVVDGVYGDKCESAAKNLQKLLGVPQDGLIGPDTWYGTWLLPVQ